MTDQDIINEFKTNRYKINPNLLKYYENKKGKRFNKEVYEYIINRYNDSESFKESLCRIILGIEYHPLCPICGNKIPFKYNLNYKIFNNCCSQHCTNIYLNKIGKLNTKESIKKANITRKLTLKDKYGIENSFQLSEVINTIQEKKREYFNSERYNINEIVKKYRNTNISRYGGHPMSTKEVQDKRKTTCLKKYGYEYPMQSNIVKHKLEQTCIEKYGVKNYSLSNEYNNRKQDIVDKIYQIKKQNHSFNISKPEEELYLYIKEKFPEVKRQYKEERYPYNCDFYIPELDYFIELQGYYTHNTHPYNPNSISDKLLVEKYKEKYGMTCQAITIWTIKDPEKRECARRNNLNFKEVWSLEEGKEFIDNLYNTMES